MSRTAAIRLVATALLIAATLVSSPAEAQGGEPTVYGLAFAGPSGGSATTASEGTGTLTVPADGLGITLSVEVSVASLDLGDIFLFFVRDVGSVAGDDTTCPTDPNAILNGAMEQTQSGWAFSGGTQTLSGDLPARTLTASFDSIDRAGDTRLAAGEYAIVVVDPNFTVRGCAELTDFDGGLDTATTVDQIQASEDYVPLEHGEILGLYKAIFNREPDFDGANYWITTVYEGGLLTGDDGQPLTDAGEKLQQITELFANEDQPEFQAAYGHIVTDADFVAEIYSNVLGRSGDADGVAYWTDQLAQGLSRPEALRWMALGAEFICGRGAYGRPCPL